MVFNMFENKQINGYVYATRFIASWVRAGGTFSVNGKGYKEFEDWLRSLQLNDSDIEHILFLAKNGKLELERSARLFLKEQQ